MSVSIHDELREGLALLAEYGDEHGAEGRVQTRVRRRRVRRRMVRSTLCVTLVAGAALVVADLPRGETRSGLDASEAPGGRQVVVDDESPSTTTPDEAQPASGPTTTPARPGRAPSNRGTLTPDPDGIPDPDGSSPPGAPKRGPAPPRNQLPGTDPTPDPGTNPAPDPTAPPSPTTTAPFVWPADPVPSPTHLVVTLNDWGLRSEPAVVDAGDITVSFADRRSNGPHNGTILSSSPTGIWMRAAGFGLYNHVNFNIKTPGPFYLAADGEQTWATRVSVMLPAARGANHEPSDPRYPGVEVVTIDVTENGISFPYRDTVQDVIRIMGHENDERPIAVIEPGPKLVVVRNLDGRRHEIQLGPGIGSVLTGRDVGQYEKLLTFVRTPWGAWMYCSQHGNVDTSPDKAYFISH